MHGKELNFEAILELKGLGGASRTDEHVFSKNQCFVCFFNNLFGKQFTLQNS